MSLIQLSKRAEAKFIGTCPSGGQWYACPDSPGSSNFVGCCASDPCSAGCSQGNIQPVAFDVGLNFTLGDASCGSSSDFYTCNSGVKTFWGCCKSNPCRQEQTCPTGDLVPAFMERKEQFLVYVGQSETTSSATATGTGTVDPSATGRPQSTHTVAIIAGAVGGVLGLAIIIAIVVCVLCRRKRRDRKIENVETRAGFPSETTPMTEKHDNRESSMPDAPPMYTSPNPNAYPPSPAFHTQYKQEMADVQELPAEVLSGPSNSSHPNSNRLSELPASTSLSPKTSPNPNRYSELPANLAPISQMSPNPNRMSELPAEGAWMAELESPVSSPRPQQATFAPGSVEKGLSSKEEQGTPEREETKAA